MKNRKKLLREIAELEKKVKDIETRIPPHSIPMRLLQDLEEAQEELKNRKKELELFEEGKE